jgi:hypothetical protein
MVPTTLSVTFTFSGAFLNPQILYFSWAVSFFLLLHPLTNRVEDWHMVANT